MKISICIPSYKRIHYLQRLLDSIVIQTYKDFEVVITDDSNDDSVQQLLKNYEGTIPINYYQNRVALGTPENWNEGIRRANGEWIKIMHDDDWFAQENALEIFHEAIVQNPGQSFIFSAYNNVVENKDLLQPVFLTRTGQFLLKKNPLNIFKNQFVGNPSCTIIKKDIAVFYDNRFKWVVDFEYYIRCLQKLKDFYYINSALINVGINDTQVTQFSFRKREVEIPENHLLVEKMGASILRNIFVYDYYWRLYRNLGIRSIQEINDFYKKPLHPVLRSMIRFQKFIPLPALKVGVVSKVLMVANYFASLFRKV